MGWGRGVWAGSAGAQQSQRRGPGCPPRTHLAVLSHLPAGLLLEVGRCGGVGSRPRGQDCGLRITPWAVADPHKPPPWPLTPVLRTCGYRVPCVPRDPHPSTCRREVSRARLPVCDMVPALETKPHGAACGGRWESVLPRPQRAPIVSLAPVSDRLCRGLPRPAPGAGGAAAALLAFRGMKRQVQVSSSGR